MNNGKRLFRIARRRLDRIKIKHAHYKYVMSHLKIDNKKIEVQE